MLRRDSQTWLWCIRGIHRVSQMTVANVMDVIAGLPRCAEQAADAVSAYNQVKIEDDPGLPKKTQKSECPDFWTRLPRHQNPVEGKTRWGSSSVTWTGKSSELGMSLVHRKQGLFLSVFVDDIKMDGREQNMAPMWNQIDGTCGSI